jgi:hypothetical protein
MECNNVGVDESSEIAHACVFMEMRAGFFIYTYVNYYYFLILKNYWRQYKGGCFALHFMSGGVGHQS